MTLDFNVLRKYIIKNDKVLVGVSGGADSMCLLDLVYKYSKLVDFEFCAIHINHHIRDKEAKRDEDFVKQYCLNNGIDCKVIHIDAKQYAVGQGKTVEQAGRELRYQEFNKELEQRGASKILVAHHSGDQAETILMHISRGSSMKGARGMLEKNGNIVRPLLQFSKEQILEYIENNGIPCIEDSSNQETKYARNFVRLEVLPKLKELYPDIEKTLCAFASHCSRDEDFIESILPKNIVIENKGKVYISKDIINTHMAVSTRLVKKAFEMLQVFADVEEKHIMMVLQLFELKNGSEISLPHNVIAFKEYDNVALVLGKKKNKITENIFTLGETKIKGYGSIFAVDITGKQDPEFGDGNHYVDYQKIPMNAVWRTRQEGDVFSKLGAGSKKLADYFTDKKVPKRIRDLIPILAVGNKVLVVAGFDISDWVKISADTEQIVKLIYIH